MEVKKAGMGVMASGKVSKGRHKQAVAVKRTFHDNAQYCTSNMHLADLTSSKISL